MGPLQCEAHMANSIHTRQYRAFKNLLRELREAQGMTQAQLAKRLKIPQSAVSKCEAAERRLDVIELRDWCHVLDVPFLKFMEKLEHRIRHVR
jgi:transcriptional regulator with XRE-family HTH domain